MANRPTPLCELEKGKFVGGQKGFVDTFNYAVRSIDNLSGGKNCTVDRTIPDHPVINVDIPEDAFDSGGGGGGEITMVGTDSTSAQGDTFTFQSGQYSNVHVSIDPTGTMSIDVYYV